MEIPFTKMSGAGNDFIVIDNREGLVPVAERGALLARWCQRRTAIGADGVLLVEPATRPGSHFQMRYYNADGSEGETCGNGSRCIARFAFVNGIAPRAMTFEAVAGLYTAAVLENDHVHLHLSDAFDLQLNRMEFSPAGEPSVTVHFVNTGVPHAVIFVEDLSRVDAVGVGRALRQHPEFAPAGTNANFVQVTGPDQLKVRTYERGVEDETLACGTGCVASAILAQAREQVSAPVAVTTASGEVLTIQFSATPGAATGVTLEGSAHITFRGVVQL